jgi:hypothetical protein
MKEGCGGVQNVAHLEAHNGVQTVCESKNGFPSSLQGGEHGENCPEIGSPVYTHGNRSTDMEIPVNMILLFAMRFVSSCGNQS